MKKIIIILSFVILFQNVQIFAQVAKISIVEHFTNTSCSVCANNNPSIYSSLNANPNILHISFHPSSPYITDIFSQSNKVENDARTTFYNIFGSTPKTILNGLYIPYNTLNSALPTLSTETSNFKLSIKQIKKGTDSLTVESTIIKVANDTSNTALLFLGVIEDTIFQTTSNGEQKHYNVFRKSLTNINGLTLNLPQQVGDSIVIKNYYKVNSTWQINRLNTIGILQHLNQKVINSSKSKNSINIPSSIIEYGISNNEQLFYPNPANKTLNVNKFIKNLYIYDSNGKIVLELTNIIPNQIIDVSNLNKGTYIFVIKDENLFQTQKIVIQ